MNKRYIAFLFILFGMASGLLAVDPIHLTVIYQYGIKPTDNNWGRTYQNNTNYPVKLVVNHYSESEEGSEDYNYVEMVYPSGYFSEYRSTTDYTTQEVIVSEEAFPATPVLSAADQITGTGFRVVWGSTANAASYRVDLSTVANFSTFVTGYNNYNNGTATSITVTGLTNGVVYYYRVRGINSQGNAGSNATGSVQTIYTVPAAPQFPSSGVVTALAEKTFTINWNADANATSYLVDLSADAAFLSYFGAYSKSECTNTSFVFSNLVPNTRYYYRVFAKNAAGTSVASEVRYAIPSSGVPTAPSAFYCVSGLTKLTAVWSPVINALSYRISVSTDSQMTTLLPGYNDLPVGNICQYSITGLQPNTVYYVRLKSLNGNGSATSSIYSAQTKNYGLSLIYQTIYLDPWSNTYADYTSRYDNETDRELLVTYTEARTYSSPLYGTNSSSSASVTLRPGESFYEQRITSRYQDGGNVWFYRYAKTIQSFTVLSATQVPSVPNLTAATSITNQSFIANWQNIAAAYTYRIDVSNRADFATTLAEYTNKVIDAGAGPACAISGLQPNTTYYYRVRAANSAGTSTSSSTSNTTTTNILPGAPTIREVDSVMATGFTVRWYGHSNASGYRVDVATDAGFVNLVSGWANYLVPGGSITDSVVVSGLTQNQIYYIRVKSENSAGVSAPSSTAVCTPMAAAPAAPVLLSPSQITASTALLRWNAAAGANDYRLDVSTNSSFTAFLPGKCDLSLGNVTSILCQQLVPSSTLYYRVRAKNCSLVSTNSSVGQVTTQPSGRYLTPTTYLEVSEGGVSGWSQMYQNQNSYSVTVVVSDPPGSPQTITVAPNEQMEEYDYSYDDGSSDSQTIMSQTIPDGDSTAPGAPGNLALVAAGPSYATIQWTASTDNVGVIAYWIYKNGATSPSATVNGLVYNDESLSPSTTYTFVVRALDAAGNLSAASSTLSVTTLANQTVDSDADGVPDAVENAMQTNPNSAGQKDTTGQLNLQIHRPTNQP